MGRIVLGVVVGYVAMIAAVFSGLVGLYLVLGPDQSFQPGTYDPSVTWLVLQFTIMILVAVAAGWVSRVVGRRAAAPLALAVIAVVVGLSMDLSTMGKRPDPGPRSGDVPSIDAMKKAKRPAWVLFVTPVISAVGIPLGGWRRAASGRLTEVGRPADEYAAVP